MTHCPRCGIDTRGDTLFCHGCGLSLRPDPAHPHDPLPHHHLPPIIQPGARWRQFRVRATTIVVLLAMLLATWAMLDNRHALFRTRLGEATRLECVPDDGPVMALALPRLGDTPPRVELTYTLADTPEPSDAELMLRDCVELARETYTWDESFVAQAWHQTAGHDRRDKVPMRDGSERLLAPPTGRVLTWKEIERASSDTR